MFLDSLKRSMTNECVGMEIYTDLLRPMSLSIRLISPIVYRFLINGVYGVNVIIT